ncbi:MAG: molybdopterin molybdotransferase MoeA [Paracoccaceae bacterium]|nr:MAG: molybdopterin molybdotransferase MoeA [Paracoccaceae bacterium]
MIPVDEAQARVLALSRRTEIERIPLARAAGRWLAAPVSATRDQPPFAASAMDGYAVSGPVAPGATFRVVGRAAAGRRWDGRLAPGQAIRLFTGSPVPEGTTAVLIQEDAEVAGDTVTARANHDGARHIRARGQDFTEGFTVEPRRLRPLDLGLLAAMNLAEVPVARRPVVALIATGDELVMPGEVPHDDQIVASNTFALKAMAEAEGAVVRMLPVARDDPALLAAVFDLAAGADLVVTTGGASVGDHDLVAGVAQSAGMEVSFHKVAMRPGKPLMAGRMGGAAMLGLPGNPVSAIVCGLLFLLPLIRSMQGDPAPLPRPQAARLLTDVGPTGPRTHYMRARIEPGDGLPGIAPDARQDSALLSVLAGADALLIRPAGDGPRLAGETVTFLPI